MNVYLTGYDGDIGPRQTGTSVVEQPVQGTDTKPSRMAHSAA